MTTIQDDSRSQAVRRSGDVQAQRLTWKVVPDQSNAGWIAAEAIGKCPACRRSLAWLLPPAPRSAPTVPPPAPGSPVPGESRLPPARREVRHIVLRQGITRDGDGRWHWPLTPMALATRRKGQRGRAWSTKALRRRNFRVDAPVESMLTVYRVIPDTGTPAPWIIDNPAESIRAPQWDDILICPGAYGSRRRPCGALVEFRPPTVAAPEHASIQ